MPKEFTLLPQVLNQTIPLFFLAISLTCANTSRILSEGTIDPPILPPGIVTSNLSRPHVLNPIPTTSGIMAQKNPLTFFMHDILGGSAPSERIVTGITATTQINGLPFAKPNNRIFPLNGGIPLISSNKNNHNNNGINGNNLVSNSNTIPFVNAGQLPQEAPFQQLMFGTITVIDDELTEGHELGSSVIGKGQGFFLASSLDGSSHTLAFTAMFGDEEEDSISFFGVHRTASDESLLAIVGGTGKYNEAEGYAKIETLHLTDQHITDGVETLLRFSVFLTY